MKKKIPYQNEEKYKPYEQKERGTKGITEITVRVKIMAHIEKVARNMSLSLAVLK